MKTSRGGWIGRMAAVAVALAGLAPRAEAVSATGGTVNNYRDAGTNWTAHIFTNTAAATSIVFSVARDVEVLVVAGGGGGAYNVGGGGGAGGYIYTNLSLSTNTYAITVGAGGAGGTAAWQSGTNGGDSIFGTLLTAKGGGNGGSGGGGSGPTAASDGGSGGGCNYASAANSNGKALTLSPMQGNDGGIDGPFSYRGGGGGGAGHAGYGPQAGGNGGAGLSNNISGNGQFYAGGGGGGSGSTPGTGGSGVGGDGGGPGNGGNGKPGKDGTGSGGGGGGTGAAGGSGIVIVRYVSQVPLIQSLPVTNVTSSSACFNGYLTDIGADKCGVCVLWGETSGGATWNWARTNWLTPPVGGWTNNSPLSINITSSDGIESSKNYYYTYAATNQADNGVAPSPQYFITGEVTVQATITNTQYRQTNQTNGQFTICRPATCTNEALTVNYTTSGAHYTLSPAASVTFNAGVTSKVVTVTPDPVAANVDATLTLTGSSSNNYPIGTSSNATVTILSVDATPTAPYKAWGVGDARSIFTNDVGTSSQKVYAVHQYTNTASVGYIIPSASIANVEVLVVAGGGGGARNVGGGGGAGGYIYTNLSVSPNTYAITVGAGGAGGTGAWQSGTNGGDSIFGTLLTAKGGGNGGSGGGNAGPTAASDGGSGGGCDYASAANSNGKALTLSPMQGNDGGIGSAFNYRGGGGGGAGHAGYGPQAGGNGGAGLSNNISGNGQFYAGGGGGGSGNSTPGTGGSGVGGDGGSGTGNAGKDGTGSGGGGSGFTGFAGGAGGSGIVIVRYDITPPPPVGSVLIIE